MKKRAGEYVQAAKTENMCWEVKMKSLFYNSILKFDATGELPWVTSDADSLDSAPLIKPQIMKEVL